MAEKIKIVLDIGAEIKDLQSKIPQLQQQLNKVKLTGLSGQNLTTDFENIQKRFKKLQEQAEQPFTAKADFSKMEKEVVSVQSAIKSFTKELLQLQNSTDKKKLELLPDDQKQKIDKVTKALDLIADENGNIDIENILTEMTEGLLNTNPFLFKTQVIGDIEIGGG